MELEEIRAQLEEELTWRINEFKFLKNLTSNIYKEEQKDIYRKTLLVMLYSHFEGLCKSCFLIYVEAINSLQLQRQHVNQNLQAASMNTIFNRYDDKDRKCKIFKRSLPEETQIHSFFRRTDFVIQYDDFLKDIVKLPDELVDTESNLWYIVLQKNLFKLGIDLDIFKDNSKQINNLVNLRNSIAHGNLKRGLQDKEFEEIEHSVTCVMNNLVRTLYYCLRNKDYLKDNEII
ncbi:hypothetical protein LL037_08390 [Clostridium estertheticum]|uniref:MAE_28990/MAE_18760 family HEPN-like nuclease n=1 Tax=Clostridium estertheticum TaxID=238834 RepID=UPI001C0C6FB5|nr:MAE_28990/MAE_18760 family HEPN-like nuclease [Clostridium estertheticum]MBU3201738.1 hypothetical protein [Clostridium estertheticum]WAG67132.1 hypothetical protein LL037_08390 [Clostridium estertheticum]